MGNEELQKKWNDLMKETFQRFVDENIGTDDDGRPKCYGTGDGESWCQVCFYRPTC